MKALRASIVAAGFFSFAIACGGAAEQSLFSSGDGSDGGTGTTNGGGGGSDGGGSGDAQSDRTPPSGCDANAKPACLCGTPVCNGSQWSCTSCPGPFTCGNKTCNSGDVCLGRAPGILLPDGGVPPTYYECQQLPAQCKANATCGCVQPLAQTKYSCWGSQCDDSDGHVRLGCMGQ